MVVDMRYDIIATTISLVVFFTNVVFVYLVSNELRETNNKIVWLDNRYSTIDEILDNQNKQIDAMYEIIRRKNLAEN